MADNETVKFTSTKAIDEFQVGQYTIDITGYVDSIESPRVVGPEKTLLLKVILNNRSGRKISVLFWGDRAEEYLPLLQVQSIVTFTCIKAIKIDTRYALPDLGLIELSVQSYTVITTEPNLHD